MEDKEIFKNILPGLINLESLDKVFGQKRIANLIEIQEINLKYDYRIELNTEYRIRETRNVTKPYDGSSFYGISSDFQISRPSSFVKEKHSYRINGSQNISTCYNCRGKGKVTCPSCNGRGEVKCSACSGKGYVTCTRCDGKGYIERIEYNYEKKENITKQEKCSYCYNGTKKCYTCDGSGIVKCSRCNSSGIVTCSTCSGYGELISYDVLDIEDFPEKQIKYAIFSNIEQSKLKSINGKIICKLLSESGKLNISELNNKIKNEKLEENIKEIIENSVKPNQTILMQGIIVEELEGYEISLKFKNKDKILWIYEDGNKLFSNFPFLDIKSIFYPLSIQILIVLLNFLSFNFFYKKGISYITIPYLNEQPLNLIIIIISLLLSVLIWGIAIYKDKKIRKALREEIIKNNISLLFENLKKIEEKAQEFNKKEEFDNSLKEYQKCYSLLKSNIISFFKRRIDSEYSIQIDNYLLEIDKKIKNVEANMKQNFENLENSIYKEISESENNIAKELYDKAKKRLEELINKIDKAIEIKWIKEYYWNKLIEIKQDLIKPKLKEVNEMISKRRPPETILISKNYEIGGKYIIVKQIGIGGMSIVFEGYDKTNNNKVAIKKMREDIALNKSAKNIFTREAQNMQKLNHPNIIKFYEIVEDEKNLYLIFEFIEGGTLFDLIEENKEKGKRFSLKESIYIIKNVCEAIKYSHSQNIIHCDIKPSNIMIANPPVSTFDKGGIKEGFVKVMDFGIAWRMKDITFRISGEKDIWGTPAYMSPEQEHEGYISNQSDIYNIAATFYEILTNQLPFQGADIYKQKVDMNYLKPSEIIKDIPPIIDNIISKAFQFDIKKRYKEIDEFLMDINRVS